MDSAAANGLKKLTWANLKATLFAYFQGLFREKLTAARTYYVRTDGSNSNDGLSNTGGGAFLTIQKAIDVASALDNGGFAITIQVADGTYTAGNALKSFLGSGTISIVGNVSTPSNCLVSTTGSCFVANGVVGRYSLSGFKVQTTTSGFCVAAIGGVTYIALGVMDYGAVAANFAHLYCEGGASIAQSSTSYTISGGGAAHIQSVHGGAITQNVNTVTITGTPAFSIAFAQADNISLIRAVSNTYSGSATGPRYSATGNAVIDTAGGGASYLPGNSAGSAPSGLYR
ncbi:hypothetical protein [Acidovorax sp. 93]|uniref:hypothetical protein n=1 Tax=Acidovorax sp. 93 TaxID=2135632 RepID=UPI001F2844DF|nr:hypothetical protein [Acidovorax sp. 93]